MTQDSVKQRTSPRRGLVFQQIDAWETDTAKLDAPPESGVSKSRDLRNMPILAGRLPIMRWSGMRESAGR
jgi:hypothetical protein